MSRNAMKNSRVRLPGKHAGRPEVLRTSEMDASEQIMKLAAQIDIDVEVLERAVNEFRLAECTCGYGDRDEFHDHADATATTTDGPAGAQP